MPAAVAKGILISISIITALSIAVLENPQVQAWLEQQRQKIAELLRSIGQDLDPQSRRMAEAFAYEGRTPATDAGLQREVSASREAAAVATGRSMSSPSTIRRVPIKGPADPEEAEERRRKGREYLAKRNQEMYELKQRKQATTPGETPPSPTSFDAMVDDEGKLKLAEVEKELPSPPTIEPLPEAVKAEMREVERNLEIPALAEASSSNAGASGWSFGALLANPFSDEYALDRSETPKPPVPPKVAFDIPEDPPISTLPGSFTPRQSTPQPQEQNEELSYEEQLAIALSLSEADAASSRRSSQAETQDDDVDLRAAIEASLKEMNDRQAAAFSSDQSRPRPAQELEHSQPLVDLTPPSPTIQPHQPMPRSRWDTIFDHQYSPTHEPLSLASNASQPDEEDELYRVTPELTHARLATLNSRPVTSPPSTSSSLPYDPVRDAASRATNEQHGALEASFYSAASSAPSPASTHTMDHETAPQLVDVDGDVPAGARTPTSHTSFAFQTDSESDSDTFASMSAPASQAHSRARSEISEGEVVDVVEDSDVDMLSEEGDDIATPDSWSEVGSQEGDSEMDDAEHPRRVANL
ncbi:hypothetical protein LTR09_006740 [Extremus antarcticus]|uniref:Uncharacterized protein n=1 Tax=Extremus antarcticus TaxID=702011 RepID=A0AAJ0G7J7_9PEZI|nr:hypothetical protein LTR09_006740 [Extremus antarcticus]